MTRLCHWCNRLHHFLKTRRRLRVCALATPANRFQGIQTGFNGLLNRPRRACLGLRRARKIRLSLFSFETVVLGPASHFGSPGGPLRAGPIFFAPDCGLKGPASPEGMKQPIAKASENWETATLLSSNPAGSSPRLNRPCRPIRPHQPSRHRVRPRSRSAEWQRSARAFQQRRARLRRLPSAHARAAADA